MTWAYYEYSIMLSYGSIAVAIILFLSSSVPPPLFFSFFPSHILPVAGDMRNEDRLIPNSVKLDRTLGAYKLTRTVSHLSPTFACLLFADCFNVGLSPRD